MKGYILMENGYSYDDNYYSRDESGSGHPNTIFLSKEAAMKAMWDKEFLSHCVTDLGNYYFFEDFDLKNDKEFNEMMNEFVSKYGKGVARHSWDESTHLRPLPSYSEEDKAKYLDFFKKNIRAEPSFWCVVEVDFDATDVRDTTIQKILD